MRWYRRLILVTATATAAAMAGVTALTAEAVVGDTSVRAERSAAECAVFPDGSEPVGATGTAAGTSHRVCGRFLDCYRANGGPGGPFGLPVDDERPNSLQPDRIGERVQGFRRADMFLTGTTGDIAVGGWFAYAPLQEAERTLPSCPPGP